MRNLYTPRECKGSVPPSAAEKQDKLRKIDDMKKETVSFMIAYFILGFFSLNNFVAQAQTNDIKICSVFDNKNMEALDAGEQLCSCPPVLAYIHKVFKFAVSLPENWSKIRRYESNPEDNGKISSIIIAPDDVGGSAMPLIQFRFRKTSAASLEEVIKEKDSMEAMDGLTIDSEPEKVVLDGVEAMKFDFIQKKTEDRISYLVLKNGVVYSIQFSCFFCDDKLENYSRDFQRIINTVRINTEFNCSEQGLFQ